MRNRPTRILCAALLCMLISSAAADANMCHDMPAEAGHDSTSQAWLQFTYQFTRMDQFKQGSTTRSLDEARAYLKPDGTAYTSLPLTMDMVRYTMIAGTGIGPRFKAVLSLPFVRNTMDMTSSRGVMLGWADMTMEPTSGVGDATVLGMYRLFTTGEPHAMRSFSLGLGVKTPTGSSTERSESGSLIHMHMQPGTGSWDPFVTALYATTAGPVALQADATYRVTTSNRQGYEFGDTVTMGLGGTYRIADPLAVTAGLTYRHEGRASDRNGSYYDPATNDDLMDDPANTGGDSLWFAPGIQVFPLKHLVFDARVQLPLWQRVNGIQLVARSSLFAGVSYHF